MMLKDKVAIITGGSSGIGKAAAFLFAKEGAAVTIIDQSGDGTQVAADINGAGGECLFLQSDLRDKEGIKAAVESVVSQFGKIDILFSNAGINPHIGKIEETSDEQWESLIDINLRSCFEMIKAVVPHMVERKSGAIVATSSISGRVWAASHSVPYGVSKTGIEAIIKSVAVQYGPSGIRSNCMLMEGLRCNNGAVQERQNRSLENRIRLFTRPSLARLNHPCKKRADPQAFDLAGLLLRCLNMQLITLDSMMS